MTVFAEALPPQVEGDEHRPLPVPLFMPSSLDSVTLTEDESVEDRWTDICGLVERTLAASIAEFARFLE